MATDENLRDAFAGESQANRKYLAFARRAEQEGLPQVARLFRAAAEAETVHALAHLRVMKGVKSTVENLQEAVDGESFEYKDMYPRYVATAMDEGHKIAMLSFHNAMAAEQVHYSLYVEALSRVKAGEDLPERRVYVCSTCGNIVFDEVPQRCPLCNAGKEKFHTIK
jgi:rubrerythrin